MIVHDALHPHGRPLLGPPRKGPETEAFLKQAYTDIPICIAGIREHYHCVVYDNAKPLRVAK